MHYYYDASGSIAGFEYNGSPYYYQKNLQGDIIRICNIAGNTVVEYTYDAWGKVLSVTGSLASTVGQANPFRYRGYYYDTETGFYYLQSRYYDSSIQKFLNADEVNYLGTNGNFISYNLYTYCDNNPVMGYDPEGTWNWGGFIIGAAIVAATVLTVATYGTGSALGAIIICAAISTGTTMMYAAANDAAMVMDVSFSGRNTASMGVSYVMDFKTGNAELYLHCGIVWGNASGLTYSTGVVSNYHGRGSYGGVFVQGGVNVYGLGINYCYDPNEDIHKKAVKATTITFSKPDFMASHGSGWDHYWRVYSSE